MNESLEQVLSMALPDPAGAAAATGRVEAEMAMRVFAVDPVGVGGVRLRACAGEARDAWLAGLRACLPPEAPWRRLPSHIGDERLLGGLDLAATLRARHVVARTGVLAEADGGVLLVAMAERCEPATAARIAAVIDGRVVRLQRDGITLVQPARIGLVALDEAAVDDAQLPEVLAERLGIVLRLDLAREAPVRVLIDALPAGTLARGSSPATANANGTGSMPPAPGQEEVARARALLPDVTACDAIVTALCEAAQTLGIASLRAPSLALRVACIVAALAGRREVGADDAAWAARLVLGPRARAWPGPAEAPAEQGQAQDAPMAPSDAAPPPAPQEATGGAAAAPPRPATASAPPHTGARAEGEAADLSTTAPPPPDDPLEDRLVEAAAAALPAALLGGLASALAARPAGALKHGRSGAAHRSTARGRPIGSQRGPLRGAAHLDLLQTLRAAAPWQALRRQESAPGAGARGVLVRSEDFHVRRYRERQESTTIFAVDASGSQALNRLAEAKGAVELLLADCYVRRDRVAVLAFRGTAAEVLLPPTRSLVRAKRCLCGLPGGGGTPLASAIDAAHRLARGIARDGGTPLLVLLTDGSANVARDGSHGRPRACADALAAARAWATMSLGALLIDTSPRPRSQAQALAQAMQARYVALPNADAAMLAGAVGKRGRQG